MRDTAGVNVSCHYQVAGWARQMHYTEATVLMQLCTASLERAIHLLPVIRSRHPSHQQIDGTRTIKKQYVGV